MTSVRMTALGPAWLRRGRGRQPKRIPFGQVAAVNGRAIYADLRPLRVRRSTITFPGGVKVRVDRHGNPSVTGSLISGFRLRVEGPGGSDIEIGKGEPL